MTEVRNRSERVDQSVLAEQDERYKQASAVATRLIMIDVTWAHWGVTPSTSEAQRSWLRHKSLLEILLGGCPSYLTDAGEPDSSRAQPGAWISLEPQESALKEKVDSLRGGVNIDDLLWPSKWFNEEMKEIAEGVVPWRIFVDTDRADKAVRFIVDGLQQCELTANRVQLRKQPGLLAAQMNLFACRIYLTPERAAGLIHGPAGKYQVTAPGHAIIDLRFREHLGRYWLYATFSVWTHQPSIPLYPLNSADDRGDVSPLADRLEALRNRYTGALRRGFQDHVHAFFPTAQMTILDRKYRPPRFWMVRGRDLTTTGAAAANGHAVGSHELLGTLLCVPQPGTIGLGAGDIDGRARVFRRFMPNARWAHDRPVYLVLPFSPSATDQEDYLRSVIRTLSDLEADAATRLFDIITDIDLYRSQLNLYDKIAAQGLALWDQLALFLPVARDARLRNTHRLIELIHQILLQGIADLEEEAANAQHTIERIKVVADDLIDQFDRKFTERPVPGHVAIRDSLVKAGYFDKARSAAQSVNERSRQVRDTFKALLESMTYAFDERRARETDVLQWVALLFAIVLGAASTWNTFLAEYITNWRNVGPWVGFGGAAIGLMIGAVWVMRRRRSRLTNGQFNKHFEKLRNLLAVYSSDRLDRLREEDEQDALSALANDKDDPEIHRQVVTTAQEKALKKESGDWRRRDERLAKEIAALLDSLPKPPRGERSRDAKRIPKAKLGELRTRVEVWALRALLVTERPRQFCSSALPIVTFLYRFFPIISGKPSQESDWSAVEDQVSDGDFRLTVQNQCGGEPEHVPVLMRWGHWQVRELQNSLQSLEQSPPKVNLRWGRRKTRDPPIASQFVKKLKEVGLSGHMTNRRFLVMMEKMNRSLWDPEEFKGWNKEAIDNLEAAKSLRANEFYQSACVTAEDSAQLKLTGFLRGVGAGVPADYDLVRLGAEARATMGGPLPQKLQDAIWRLSAYPKPRDQLSTHPAGRATPREYGESDAKTALDDAKIVLEYVDGYVDQWNRGALRSSD
jgi:HEPN domain-containing protein